MIIIQKYSAWSNSKCKTVGVDLDWLPCRPNLCLNNTLSSEWAETYMMLWITIMNKIYFWKMWFLLTRCSLNSEHRSFCFQLRAAPVLEICDVWLTVHHMCGVALSVFVTTSITFTYTVTNVAGGSHAYCYQTWKIWVNLNDRLCRFSEKNIAFSNIMVRITLRR